MSNYTEVAHSFTRDDLEADVTVLASGGLYIYAILLANASAAAKTVQLTDSDGTVVEDYVVPATNTILINFMRLVENGVIMAMATNSSDVTFTMWHSNLQGTA